LELPRHLILFSSTSLSDCIKRAGLDLRYIGTETRLARMIYATSTRAMQGGRNVGEQTEFTLNIKCGAYVFQLFEDLIAVFKKDIGEELYCVCSARAGDDGCKE